MEPVEVDGWNVAHLNGGLLLSSNDFMVQFSPSEVDKLLNILNTQTPGKLRDTRGDVVTVIPEKNHVILTRASDEIYPGGIILPVDAFSDFDEDEPIVEGIKPAFRRVGNKIKRGYRVTSGRRKGRVIVNRATANKPPISGRTRAKLRIAARRNKFVRALKSKMTRRKGASIRLRRMNHTD